MTIKKSPPLPETVSFGAVLDRMNSDAKLQMLVNVKDQDFDKILAMLWSYKNSDLAALKAMFIDGRLSEERVDLDSAVEVVYIAPMCIFKTKKS